MKKKENRRNRKRSESILYCCTEVSTELEIIETVVSEALVQVQSEACHGGPVRRMLTVANPSSQACLQGLKRSCGVSMVSVTGCFALFTW